MIGLESGSREHQIAGMGLLELFSEGDYRFRMGFERGKPEEFFRPTLEHDALVAERRHWLQTAPERYAALLPASERLLEETIEFAKSSGTVPLDFATPTDRFETPWSRCKALGSVWEPDFLLLELEPRRTVRLVAGCVCFPSSWSLEEKIGHPIEAIHGVVPGLNAAIGTQIHSFLIKLRPGLAWLRSNWGLSRSAELNQHPTRRLSRLDAGLRLEEVWLRVEHQALVALPRTNGILFGIRIAMHPLAEIRRDGLVADRLARALQTMPEDVARYKGVANTKASLLELLGR